MTYSNRTVTFESMTAQELELLIKQGEGYNVEFKQSLPSKASELAEELCAFANAAGGVVLVGISDKGNKVGVTIDNNTRSRIQNILNALQPRLEVTIQEMVIDGKTILCFECPSGTQKPYTVSGSIIVRNGPNSEKITSVERMRDFFQQADRIFFDEALCKGFSYPEDFNNEAFQDFLKRAGITPSLSNVQLLMNLRLTAGDGQLTNGAALFFAKEVQRFFDHAVVRCVLFKGTDKRFILDSKEMKGNLVEQFDQTMAWLFAKLNLSYDIENSLDGRRRERLEIPETVFRESVLNALAHRDYYEKGAVTMVEVYDDRVTITNPGGLVSSIARSEFGSRSLSRNPLVFGIMQRMNLVERVGSGINRIKDAMKETGLPEPVFGLEGFFSLTLYRPIDFERWMQSWALLLSTPQVKILLAMHDNPGITKDQLSNIVGQGKTSVDKHIEKIRSLGLIERVGSKKAGNWQINLIPPLEG